MSVILNAYQQWAKRPDDERFLSLDELYKATRARADRSHARPIDPSKLKFYGFQDDKGELVPANESVMLMSTPEMEDCLVPTNWSFGQVCSNAKADAATVRRTSPDIGASLLEWNMRHVIPSAQYSFYVEDLLEDEHTRDVDETQRLRAMTGTGYGRIYDYDVVDKVRNVNVGGNWVVPGVNGRPLEQVTKNMTTLYASDRDCFIFLVDEETPITIKKPNGGTEDLFRGFMASNSEVGKASFCLSLFLYREVCSNRMVFGTRHLGSVKIRHSSGAPERFEQEGAKLLNRYASDTLEDTKKTLAASMSHSVGDTDEKVAKWLGRRGFTKASAAAIVRRAKEEEGQASTLWDVVQGGTAMARGLHNQDKRVELERKVTKLLSHAA